MPAAQTHHLLSEVFRAFCGFPDGRAGSSVNEDAYRGFAGVRGGGRQLGGYLREPAET